MAILKAKIKLTHTSPEGEHILTGVLLAVLLQLI